MITRENYEEFFLLYVDDELTPAERMSVERFASAHPDLQEELDTLMQCRIQPEPEAVFGDKNSLLQYEESLLSYVDGELDEAGRQNVEELVRRDPEKERELLALLMTVSHPDPSIVFPDKESLYHKRRRIVLMPWLRAGVAAAVLAVVVTLALPRKHSPAVADTASPAKNTASAVTQNDSTAFHSIKTPGETNQQKGIATTVNAASTRKTLPAPVVDTNRDLASGGGRPSTLASTNGKSAAMPINNGKSTAFAATNGRPTMIATINSRPSTPTNTNGRSAAFAATNGRPAMIAAINGRPSTLASTNGKSAAMPTTNGKSAALATIGQDHTNNETDPDKVTVPVTTVAAINIPRDESSFATQALLREQESGNTDIADNMPSAAGKTKLRGLFRRVTRAFGKTADRDDDGQRQVLISAFQVALK